MKEAQALVDEVFLREEEIPNKGKAVLPILFGEYELRRTRATRPQTPDDQPANAPTPLPDMRRDLGL